MFAAYCLNGHLCRRIDPGRTMSSVRNALERVHDVTPWHPMFCSKCGEQVIVACAWCDKVISNLHPKFCSNCSRMFPWTERSLAAAKELAESANELTTQQKSDFAEFLPQLAFITPRAELAYLKITPVIESLGPPTKEFVTKLLVTVLSDAALRGLKLKG